MGMLKYETFGIRAKHTNVFVSSLTFALVICLTKITQTSGTVFHDRFQTLEGEQLLEVWHTDCHHRCSNALFEQVSLACRFDPYKLVYKRSVNSTRQHFQNASPPKPSTRESSPFITKDVSAGFLNKYKYKRHGHSIQKRGIVDECCITKPCSWEEYAEFCHTDHRRRALRENKCNP